MYNLHVDCTPVTSCDFRIDSGSGFDNLGKCLPEEIDWNLKRTGSSIGKGYQFNVFVIQTEPVVCSKVTERWRSTDTAVVYPGEGWVDNSPLFPSPPINHHVTRTDKVCTCLLIKDKPLKHTHKKGLVPLKRTSPPESASAVLRSYTYVSSGMDVSSENAKSVKVVRFICINCIVSCCHVRFILCKLWLSRMCFEKCLNASLCDID